MIALVLIAYYRGVDLSMAFCTICRKSHCLLLRSPGIYCDGLLVFTVLLRAELVAVARLASTHTSVQW